MATKALWAKMHEKGQIFSRLLRQEFAAEIEKLSKSRIFGIFMNPDKAYSAKIDLNPQCRVEPTRLAALRIRKQQTRNRTAVLGWGKSAKKADKADLDRFSTQNLTFPSRCFWFMPIFDLTPQFLSFVTLCFGEFFSSGISEFLFLDINHGVGILINSWSKARKIKTKCSKCRVCCKEDLLMKKLARKKWDWRQKWPLFMGRIGLNNAIVFPKLKKE